MSLPPTERQLQILSMAAQGLNNKEIATEIYLSVGTVRIHMSKLFKRIGARGRTNAVAIALARGLIDYEDYSQDE